MNESERARTRVAILALAVLGRGPGLLLGTRGRAAIARCRGTYACLPPVREWLESHRRLGARTLGERFDRLFEPELGALLPPGRTLRALEEARRLPVRRFDGEPTADILVFSPETVRRQETLAHLGPDRIRLADPNLNTPSALAEFLCPRIGPECTTPAPELVLYPGQTGFRIFVDEDGAPSRVEAVHDGESFGAAPLAINFASFTPYVTGITLDWNGGGRALVALSGRDPSRIVGGFYDVSVTLDGYDVPYGFDGSGLVIDLPDRSIGTHTLSARVAGGQLEAPIVDTETRTVDWIADFGTLTPGAAPRCIPVAPEFGPVREHPFLASIERRGETLCASVSIGTMSTIAEWPRWNGPDGVSRELRLYSEPSPILMLILVGLIAFATFLMKRVFTLGFLRRRPTHVVVARRDESGYRDVSDPERVVALSAGPISALAPELSELEAEIAVGAVVTVTAKKGFLFKRRGTAGVERGKRAALPAGTTLAFGEIQVTFVDRATAARIEAREFQALPVFSAADLSGPLLDEKRSFAAVLDAAGPAGFFTLGIGLLVGLASSALPVLGTYVGFAATSAALLGLSYLAASRFRRAR